jgi:predicted AlkP superfamily pyrophosphatase or phosphodiesterase
MKSKLSLTTLWIILLLAGTVSGENIKYVIHISIDGGGSSYIQSLIEKNKLPNFKRLQAESAGTFNARSDYDFTITLPNHTTQVTGRGIKGENGHGWTINSDPAKGQTIHSNKKKYVAGIFDVLHDNGLRTAIYAGKSKFSLFDTSYNSKNGAIDTTGVDNGRDKLDKFVYDNDSSKLIDGVLSDMKSKPFNYVFIHFAYTDAAGHLAGWGGFFYNVDLMMIDRDLGRIFKLVTTDEKLKGKTAIVLTADHGGVKYDHAKNNDPINYTIPFFVWGPGVDAGSDLYALNPDTRCDPGTSRPKYSAAVQPIRNGDAPNMELKLLGLPPIPGSTINSIQDLSVSKALGSNG